MEELKTLKEARLAAGLTQTELGLQINKSTQTIRDYEKGAYRINDAVYAQIKAIVGEFKPTRD